MSDHVSVAVAQAPVVTGDVAANLASMAKWMEEAARFKAKIVVFPECFLNGYMFDSRDEAFATSIESQGSEIAIIRTLCERFEMDVIVGFLERSVGQLFNSAAVVGPAGLIGLHRKRHLPFLGVDRFVEVPDGVEPSVFNTQAGRVGVAICYEIRFPEVMRTLALANADFIALPTNWPVQSVMLADDFTRVRAAENFVYLLVSNRADKEGGVEFLGKSQIIDPLGNVIANAYKREGISVADADVARARNKTITFKAGEFEISPWKDRRPDSYRVT